MTSYHFILCSWFILSIMLTVINFALICIPYVSNVNIRHIMKTVWITTVVLWTINGFAFWIYIAITELLV